MKIAFTGAGWEDYQYWVQIDRAMVKKINTLITECLRTPFAGLGKPEALRFDLSGWYSRRINSEHRLVYQVQDTQIVIAQCRYHY